MIRERIKEETTAQHMAVEDVSLSNHIMDGSLNKEQYASIIVANYIINAAFERSWSQLGFDIPETLMLGRREKTAILKQDIDSLGLDIPELPQLDFPVANYPQFMGTLYVFEGSTLGGRVILKQLKTNKNLAGIEAFNFYNGYGDMTGMMWKTFLDELQKIENASEINEAIEAAQKTFAITKSVFEKKHEGLAS